MFQKFRAITRLLALTLSVASLPLAVMAQNAYPQKPIRVVVTFPPGGSADAMISILSPRLNEKLGQQLVGKTVLAQAATSDWLPWPRLRPMVTCWVWGRQVA